MGDFVLSRALPFRCPVENCIHHNKITYSDISFFKGHLRCHDYTELQETALKLNLLQYKTELRSLNWLVDCISEVSIVKEDFVEI